MSDALARNAVADDAAVIRCHCLAHGWRKFGDLAEVFPHECQVGLEGIRYVFEPDEQARTEQLSPEARLAYHHAQSQPLMDALKTWLDRQFEERLVEPNSALGKAIGYLPRSSGEESRPRPYRGGDVKSFVQWLSESPRPLGTAASGGG